MTVFETVICGWQYQYLADYGDLVDQQAKRLLDAGFSAAKLSLVAQRSDQDCFSHIAAPEPEEEQWGEFAWCLAQQAQVELIAMGQEIERLAGFKGDWPMSGLYTWEQTAKGFDGQEVPNSGRIALWATGRNTGHVEIETVMGPTHHICTWQAPVILMGDRALSASETVLDEQGFAVLKMTLSEDRQVLRLVSEQAREYCGARAVMDGEYYRDNS